MLVFMQLLAPRQSLVYYINARGADIGESLVQISSPRYHVPLFLLQRTYCCDHSPVYSRRRPDFELTSLVEISPGGCAPSHMTEEAMTPIYFLLAKQRLVVLLASAAVKFAVGPAGLSVPASSQVTRW